MAIRDKLSAAVQPHLQPGETLQSVFVAQTKSQWLLAGLLPLGVLPGIIIFYALNRYRIVAVTDRRIAVFDSGAFSTTKAKQLILDMDRRGTLGPGKGLWHAIQAGHETLRVHKRFFKDFAQADALLTGPAAGPTPVLPG